MHKQCPKQLKGEDWRRQVAGYGKRRAWQGRVEKDAGVGYNEIIDNVNNALTTNNVLNVTSLPTIKNIKV